MSVPTPRVHSSEQLVRRVEKLRRTRPERALAVLEDGFADASRGLDPVRRGALWRLRAHVLRGLRRNQAAVRAYHHAERWYKRSGDVREQGRCAIGLVDSLMYLGRYDEARRSAVRGRRQLERVADPAALARLLNNEGNLFHRIDQPNVALARYRQSRQSLLHAGDRRGAAMVEGNIANCLSLLGRCSEARRLYQGAHRIHQQRDATLDALNARYNLTYLDFLEHRHERALDGLQAIRREARERGIPGLAALAALDRAEILLRLNAHEDALAEARRAVEEFDGLTMRYEKAKAETFAALAELRLGQPGGARHRLMRALADFQAEGNPIWAGEALLGLATLAWSEGAPRAGRPYMSAAIRRFAAAGDREREGCARALNARLLIECGDRRAAAAELARIGRLSGSRVSWRLRHLTWLGRAELAMAEGQRARARMWLRRAADQSERLAARILDEQWRASFWGEWGWPHRELAVLELEDGRLAAAFEALERGRGRALTDASRGRKKESLDAGVRSWAASQQARDRDRRTRSSFEPLTAKPAESLKASTRVQAALRARVPGAVTESDVRDRLPQGAMLLDYFLHRDRLNALLIDADGTRAVRNVSSEHRIRQALHSLLFTLRGAAWRSAHATDAIASPDDMLTDLASLVLWPVLRGAALPQRLAIVPSGPLARLPWAALPLPDGRRLCEACEIVVVPGLRLGLSPRPRAHATGAPLIVAVGDDDLTAVEEEARTLFHLFPATRVLLGKDATAAAFFAAAKNASWIHFAGHGVFRADAPLYSALRFADRWVSAEEFASTKLSAHWVTLSACQTARSLVSPGDEWFGLPRAFLMAGAGATVATQWDVADREAARLMGDVYQRIAAGESIAKAVSAVQNERVQEGSHPLDWAGFVVLGGPDAAQTFSTRTGLSRRACDTLTSPSETHHA